MKTQRKIHSLITITMFLTMISVSGYAQKPVTLIETTGEIVPVISIEEAAARESKPKKSKTETTDSTLADSPLSAATESASGPIGPSGTLDVTDIEPLPISDPDPVTVAPEPWMASITSTGRGAVVQYDTFWQGWAGGGFTFDGQGPIDLSSSAQLILGLKGDVGTVKLELVDDHFPEGKASVHLTGIRSDLEQVWAVDTSLFQGVDLSRVRLMYFIVEGPFQTGQLEINIRPVEPGPINPDPDLTVGQVTHLPEAWSANGNRMPQLTVVAPPDAPTWIEETSQGARLHYANGQDGWSGGGLTYDDFSTPQIETADLRTYPEVILGLRGDADHVKLEVIDEWNNKAVIYLNGIESDAIQFWNIPTAALTGVDLTRIRLIYFIMEGAFETGVLDILYQTPSKWIVPSVVPTVDGLLNEHTALPQADAMVVAPPEASVTSTVTERGLQIDYATQSATWAGGGLTFDDFATGLIETADLSGYTDIVFGLKGSAGTVKLEFVDINDQKRAVYLEGIESDRERIFRIPATYFQGLDLSQLRMIFVIVEGQNQTGTIELNHVPFDFSAWDPAPSDPRFGFRPTVIYGGPNETSDALLLMDFRTAQSQTIDVQHIAVYENYDVLLDGRYAVFEIVGDPNVYVWGIELRLTGELVQATSNPDFHFIDSYTYSGVSGWYQERLAVVNLQTGYELELVNMSNGPGYRDAFNSLYDVSPDGGHVVYEIGGGWGGYERDFRVVVQSLEDPALKVEITHFTGDFTLQSIQWMPGIVELELLIAGVTKIYQIDLTTLEVTQLV